tara:strand:+ start:3792 stop:4550 length:759 start_codon:yes stop_codon:yes gene_type:complete
MPGINRIRNRRQEQEERISQQSSTPNQEIYLRDGDQVFVQPWCTGKDDVDDETGYLDEYYLYTWNVNTANAPRFTNLLAHPDVDNSAVPDVDGFDNPIRPRRKFAFWGYVTEIIHKDLTDRGRENGWEPVESAANGTRYRETVNDFKVISLGFGRADSVFNQLIEAFNDLGGDLSKGVIRVSRIGAGLETSYNIQSTAKQRAEVEPENVLPSIMEYLLERYSTAYQPSLNGNNGYSTVGAEVSIGETNDLLF